MRTALIATIIIITSLACGSSKKGSTSSGFNPLTQPYSYKDDGLAYYYTERVDYTNQTPKKGDRVKVHYISFDKSGKELENTFNASPYEFTLGSDNIIKGFNESVSMLHLNETGAFKIPANMITQSKGPGTIPLKATVLYYKIKLIEIK